MDLWTAVRVVARHWLVLVAGLVLTGAVLVAVYVALPRSYSSTGTVIVIAPGGRTNPLTSLSSSNQLAASVAVTLAAPETSGAEVRARGGAAGYTLVADPNLPIITVTTTSSDPDMAFHTVGVVSTVMDDALGRRQQELAVPQSSWLHVVSLVGPSAAVSTGSKAKVLAIAGALGALVAISLTFIAEAISGLRRRGRELPTPEVAPTVPHIETGDLDAEGPRPQVVQRNASWPAQQAPGVTVAQRRQRTK
jgi:hypothetical protein